jgi:hypothetical protein
MIKGTSVSQVREAVCQRQYWIRDVAAKEPFTQLASEPRPLELRSAGKEHLLACRTCTAMCSDVSTR